MRLTPTAVAIICSLGNVALAVQLEFYTSAGCGLSYGSIQTPTEIGCTSLNADATLTGVKTPDTLTDSCVVSLYSDASCNTLQATVDNANGGGKSTLWFHSALLLPTWLCQPTMNILVANTCFGSGVRYVAYTVDSC